MLITQTESNQYFGRQLIGRVSSGTIKKGDKLITVGQGGEHIENAKIQRIVKKYGMSEFEVDQAFAGDIVSLAGFQKSTVGATINSPETSFVIPSVPIDPPMLSLTLTLNDSPLKGTDGDKLTVAQIRERLIRES